MEELPTLEDLSQAVDLVRQPISLSINNSAPDKAKYRAKCNQCLQTFTSISLQKLKSLHKKTKCPGEMQLIEKPSYQYSIIVKCPYCSLSKEHVVCYDGIDMIISKLKKHIGQKHTLFNIEKTADLKQKSLSNWTYTEQNCCTRKRKNNNNLIKPTKHFKK